MQGKALTSDLCTIIVQDFHSPPLTPIVNIWSFVRKTILDDNPEMYFWLMKSTDLPINL